MSADAAVVENANTVSLAGVSLDDRLANAANQANAVTGIYGISGAGKSAQADEAAIYAWETFRKITLCYVADLGGFGTKRLALIRAGIMRVWDPRNHVNAFETMELISLGAWPVALADPETGFAAPDVKLILPRRMTYQLICPQGHVAARSDSEAVWRASTVLCPTCSVPTNFSNAQRVEKSIVRHRMFADVGLRIFDSFTAMNDWGMNELQSLSAAGKLPTGSTGGSALSGADALASGQFKFSTGSKAQYGFMQNRTYAWLSNIKTIPDQVVPAIATFGVEASRSDDESGGELLLGPKIAGSARTSTLPFWLGNLLHATKEPRSETDPTMVYRLWLTNHIDPRDPRRVPYVAKHRGTPLGMPEYLEDAPGAKPWTTCSLKHFFVLLNEQLAKIEAEQREKYPTTPGIWAGANEDDDEVIGAVPTASGVSNTPAAVGATPTVVAGGASRLRRPGAVRAVAPAAASVPAASPTPAPSPVTAPAGGTVTPAVVAEQAPATVASGAASPVPAGGASTVAAPSSVLALDGVPSTGAQSPASQPAAVSTPSTSTAPPVQPASPPQPTVAPSASAPGPSPAPRRRLARPPV